MDLLHLRKKIVEISGRYDLVDPESFEDMGLDFYIQQGQRSLERRIDTPPTPARYFKDLTIGDWLIQIKNSRAIHEVWLLDTAARTQLAPFTGEDIRKLSSMAPISSADQGTPVSFYPTTLRRSPDDETGAGDSTLLQSYIDTVSPSDPQYTGLALNCPVDKAYGLEIVGLFYDLTLTEDTESNYWSTNYPTTLIAATLRELGIMYKGSKTVSDWNAIINQELSDIDKDTVSQEISHIDQMEG